MNFISVSMKDGIATVTLSRGKVNALNEPLIEQLNICFADIETDRSVRSVILTGQGKFFSFGFDIPEFLSYPKESFTRYLKKFTDLYTSLFLFSKPIVAALNGHTIAGGCMLALACDTRTMVSEKAKISLNEINFGSSVFAGSVEMLKFCVGSKNAETILYSGAMYSAEEAIRLGLIDRISSPEDLMDDARKAALDLAGKDGSSFKSLKGLLRKPVAEEMVNREKDSIREFVDIWYSEKTRRNLEEIKIYS
jgi:3,2-trans-enoyl-CoA isomerase